MENRLLSLKWNNHKVTFFETLKFLRGKTSYTDVTLAVEGKFYPVHKLVMSSCSDYFRDIFERITCTSPVIVLKDVKQQDIEALLDYMYLGEVNVNQNSLASLLKTAECLKIKGLGSPEEDPTKLCKDSTSSNDETNWTSPPSKKRRLDSNATSQIAPSPISAPLKSSNIFTSSSQTPLQTVNSTPNIYSKDNESRPVILDTKKSSSEKEYSRPLKVETECMVGSQPGQNDLLSVKVERENTNEPEDVFEREYNYEGSANSDRDTCEDYWSDIYEAEYEPHNYADTFYPGNFMQQKNNMDVAVNETSGQGNPYATDIEWTKESTLKFIEMYRQLPCLWQVKNQAYNDRNERRKGYIKIQKAFPNMSLNCVRKKINIIRTQYRREFRLYLLSKESGAIGDQIYKPKLWFFNHINFLSEGEMVTESISVA